MIYSKPKPSRDARLMADRSKKNALTKYRVTQRYLALARDNGYCVFCWFVLGRKRPATEVHHVFGRGSSPADPREHHTNLLSTCTDCHPQPIKTGGSEHLDYVKRVLEQANDTPINQDFRLTDTN